MIEETIFNTLKTLVSNRCYPMVMPQNPTLPAIVYTRVASSPQNVLEGGSTIDQIRVQVDSYATTYSAAKSLAVSIRSAMETATFKGTLQTDQDFFEPDVKHYRITQDFYVWERN